MKKEKDQMDRRTFLKTTALGSASLAFSAGVANKIGATEAEKSAASKEIPTRVLGKTGVSVPVLAMGGNEWTTNQTVLRIAFQMGVTYWDAADNYENGKCELGIGQYFAKYPEDRKKIFLETKAERTYDLKVMSAKLTQSLERMQTDYIDLFALHAVQDPDVLTPEIKAWAEQKKKEGKIRFFGFNSHANVPQMLMASAKHSWIDIINGSYNYQIMNDDMKKGMDAIAKAGIGFVAMKTMGQLIGGWTPPNMPEGQEGGPQGPGGGIPPGQEGREAGPGGSSEGPPPGMQAQTASQEPEDLSAMEHFMKKGYTLEQAKLKFVLEDERVATCLVKMGNLTILKDNVSAAADNKNLSTLDIKVLKRLAENTRSSYCQGCMRCESVMLSESRIPNVLRYMMYYNSYGERDRARELFSNIPENIRIAMASRNYSKAERVCPNGIKIGNAMREAVRLLA